jgi:hypothetical protein
MRVQRAAAPASDPAATPGAETSADLTAPADAMIVDDQAQLAAGQMPRVQFMNQLHEQVVASANEALGPVWSAVGCPYIESWFSRNASKPAADLDRMARRYSGIARPQAATDYLPPILARLRDGIARWKAGEDVGPEVAAAGLGGTTPPAAQPQTPDGAGAVQMKSAGASSAEPGSPGAVLGELGPGSALDAGHASRLGAAMDDSFGDVRIHTDSAAARKASEFGARAFTVGSHVAFAPGEYRPGTPEGDGLLAHELAHVQQQRGAAHGPELKKRGEDAASGEAYEADADSAAAGALARLYGAGAGLARGVRSVAGVAVDRARAAATSGLALQRCNTSSSPEKQPDASASAKTPDKVPDKAKPAVTDEQLGESVAKRLEQTNNDHTATKGVWYRLNYEANYPDKFKAEWADGYSVVENGLMQRGTKPFMWLLRPGASASAAVKGWLAGLTIADCASAACAAMLDSVRQTVGDDKFDEYFKLDKLDRSTKPDQVMVISQSTFGRLDTLTRQIDATKNPGTKNHRPVKKGDWHYFANHEDYPLKHPDGLFQGENAICLEDAPGKQTWAGRGVKSTDEDGMIKELATAYNEQRTRGDESKIATKSPDEQKEYKLASQGGKVADTIKESDVPGLTMKGVALDAAKVNAAFGLK